jgi:hypothetical protein
LLPAWTQRKAFRIAGAILGTLVSVLVITAIFVRVGWNHGLELDWRLSPLELARSVPGQLHWLVPFAGLTALMLVARAVQWQAALRPRVPLAARYHLVAIGALVHNTIPGKLGDVTRAYLLGRERQLPFVESVGAVAACKLFEFFWLVGLAVAALAFSPGLAEFSPALRIASASCGALVGLALCAGRFAPHFAARVRCPKVRKVIESIGHAFSRTRSAGSLARLVVLSALPVLCSATAYGLGLSGIGVARGLWLGPVVVGAIALGQSLLLVPAGTGLYYVATTFVAHKLGASSSQAVIFAACTHLATLFPQLLLGALSLWRRGRPLFPELTAIATAEAREAA